MWGHIALASQGSASQQTFPKELIRNYFPPCIKAELLAWTPWFLEGQDAYWDRDRVTGYYLPPEAAQECA